MGKLLKKVDQSLVTVADFGVQAPVSLEMSKLFPLIPQIAEEVLGFVRENNLGMRIGTKREDLLEIVEHFCEIKVKENQCEGQCLRNCSCLVYRYDGSIRCMFWTGTLFDVRKSSGCSASNLYVRVSYSELGHKKDSNKIIIIVVVVAGFVVISVSTFFSWKWLAIFLEMVG